MHDLPRVLKVLFSIIAMAFAVSVLAWVILPKHRTHVSAPEAAITPDQVAKAESEIADATRDPKKVALMECLGVKVYKDPQPPGHPPSEDECEQLEQEAEATSEQSNGQSNQESYAQEERRTAMSIYLRNRDVFLGDIRQLYFAVGCGVFASEAGILLLLSAKGDVLQREAISNSPPIIDDKAQGLMREAASQGMDRAKTANECDYWKQNPQALHDVIREAEIAAGQ